MDTQAKEQQKFYIVTIYKIVQLFYIILNIIFGIYILKCFQWWNMCRFQL